MDINVVGRSGLLVVLVMFCTAALGYDPVLDHPGRTTFKQSIKYLDLYDVIYPPISYKFSEKADDQEGYIPKKSEEVSGRINRYVFDYRHEDSAVAVMRSLQEKAVRYGYEVIDYCEREECGDVAGWKLYLSEHIGGEAESQYYGLFNLANQRNTNRKLVFYVADANGRPRAIAHILNDDGAGNFDIGRLKESLSKEGRGDIEGIHFAFGEATILPESTAALESVKAMLKQDESSYLVVGHADSIGSDQYNIALSQRRADAVVEYLIGDGSIDKDRLQSRGVGSQQPKASNQAESGRKLNRRVELIIKRG